MAVLGRTSHHARSSRSYLALRWSSQQLSLGGPERTGLSVRKHMHGDNNQDYSCCQCRRSDNQPRKVQADRGGRFTGGLPLFSVIAPVPQERDAPGGQHGQRQTDEQYPESPNPTCVPHDNLLSGMRWFVFERLQAAREERCDEQRGWEDEH